jgi:hypothetical protein
MTNAPYAGPDTTDSAVAFAPGSRKVVTPYVPPEWRGRRQHSAAATDAPMASSNAPAFEHEESLPSIGAFLLPSEERVPAQDDWPFQDAAEQTTELTGELPGVDATTPGVVERAVPSSLPMWSDDDMMDIMPSPTAHASSSNVGKDAGQSAALEGESTPHTESAARTLEMLAQRVRSGDLVLPGYAPELGDAAALAAALAALLGIRR